MPRSVSNRFALVTACAVLLTGCALRQGRPASPRATAVDQLSWLSGVWVNETADGRSEEHWMRPCGGTMIGMNRTVDGGKTSFFEYLRIETRPDGVYYIASPSGKGETPFRIVEDGPCGASTTGTEWCAEFANPEHDFPQRIIYRRLSGDRLIAVIEGTRAGQPDRGEFRWRRQRP